MALGWEAAAHSALHAFSVVGGAHRRLPLPVEPGRVGWCPTPPLDQEEGGVVAGVVVASAHQGLREPAQGLLDRATGGLRLGELLDKAVGAVLVPAVEAFLDDAVGVEQHPVPGCS